MQSRLGGPSISLAAMRLKCMDRPLLTRVKDLRARCTALFPPESLLDLGGDRGARQAELTTKEALVLAGCASPELHLKSLLLRSAKEAPPRAPFPDHTLAPDCPGLLPCVPPSRSPHSQEIEARTASSQVPSSGPWPKTRGSPVTGQTGP